jgi:hypothetical protein
MKFLIVTCDATRHIQKAQMHLLEKYVDFPFDYHYIDIGSEPIETWSNNVLDKIKDIEDELVVFGLDDFLPVGKFDSKLFLQLRDELTFHRLEFGFTSSNVGSNVDYYNIYRENQPYRLSCQFSIWNTNFLKNMLHEPMDPWQFETKQESVGATILSSHKPVMIWMEESALSGRLKNRTNVLGLKKKDLYELVKLRYIKEEEITYSWYDFDSPLDAFLSKENKEYRWDIKYGQNYI